MRPNRRVFLCAHDPIRVRAVGHTHTQNGNTHTSEICLLCTERNSLNIYARAHTHTYTKPQNTNTQTHSHTHTHTPQEQQQTNTHTHTHTHTNTQTNKQTKRENTHTNTNTHTHTHTHTNRHTHTNTNTHTHTHTHNTDARVPGRAAVVVGEGLLEARARPAAPRVLQVVAVGQEGVAHQRVGHGA